MNNRVEVGVDIGGTTISAGLIVDGKIIKRADIPTDAFKSKEVVLNNLYRAIKEVVNEDVSGIGIGVPGIVDSKEGIIYNLTNIPAWKEVYIKKLVEKQFGIKTYVGNDANCFVLGVKHFGLGKDYSNIVGVVLGTGLGAGVIINSKIYTGLESGAGEYGLVPYLDSNLEAYCSGKFFECIKNADGKEVYSKALTGDKEALDIWSEYGMHIGQLVNIILYTISPELIVFGGSVAQGFDLFIDSVHKQLESNVLTKVVENLKIKTAVNENSAILGAGALCYQ